MNIKPSSFIYGVGTGIIILSLVFYTVYSLYLSDKLNLVNYVEKNNFSSVDDNLFDEPNINTDSILSSGYVSYIIISIPDGYSIIEVAKLFEGSALIDNAEDFAEYAVNKNIEIQSGEYKIEKDWGYDEIINEISNMNPAD